MIRLAIAFVVIGLVASGLLYDRLDPPSDRVEVAAAESVIVTPSVSDPSRLDGAWFCAIGSSTEEGYVGSDDETTRADHEIQVSNLSNSEAVANIQILTSEGRGPNLRIELSPLSTTPIDLATLAEFEVAGAVVEIIGGTGVVSHTVTTDQGPATGPCGTHVSSTWYFAGGRTTLDSKAYLALMNPFPEDVVYNVELYRAAGRPRRPGALQSGVVPASSVAVIELGEHEGREDVVAVAITTVRGRLVAERLQVVDGQLGPTGAALQLGVTAPATSWMLPSGRIHSEGDDQVIVFNPSATETAEVDLDLWPGNPTDRSLYGLGPLPLQLLPGRFEVIDLRIEADRFRLRLPYEVGISVRSTNGVPVVVERWQLANAIDRSLIGAGGTEVAADTDTDTDDDGAGDDLAAPGELDIPGILGDEAAELAQPTATTGIATSRGVEVLSTRWVVPWVETPTDDSSVLIVTSPQEAVFEVFTLVNGELLGPTTASVAPGGRAIVPMADVGAGGPVLVVSEGLISVEAQIVSPIHGLSVVAGIPTVEG